eukprot:971197-Prymnesium_polylepis.1
MLCRDRTSRVELASAHSTVLDRRQTAHQFVHMSVRRAVNRLSPRGSPSRHGALLERAVTLLLRCAVA